MWEEETSRLAGVGRSQFSHHSQHEFEAAHLALSEVLKRRIATTPGATTMPKTLSLSPARFATDTAELDLTPASWLSTGT